MQGDGQCVDVTEETVKNLFEVQWPHSSNWRIIPWLPNWQNSRAKYLMARCHENPLVSNLSLHWTMGTNSTKKNHQPCQGARGARHPDVVLVAGYHQPVRIGAHKEPYGVRLSTLSTSPRFYRQFPRIWVSQHRWWNPFMCWTIDASLQESDMISSLMWVINCSKLMYLPPFFPTWWSQVGWTNRLLARETATTTPAMLAFRTWMLFAENGRDISKKTMTFQIWRGTKYKKKQLGVAIHQMDSDASLLYAPGIEKWMFHFSDFYGFINLSGSLGQFLRRAPGQVSRPNWGRSWGYWKNV